MAANPGEIFLPLPKGHPKKSFLERPKSPIPIPKSYYREIQRKGQWNKWHSRVATFENEKKLIRKRKKKLPQLFEDEKRFYEELYALNCIIYPQKPAIVPFTVLETREQLCEIHELPKDLVLFVQEIIEQNAKSADHDDQLTDYSFAVARLLRLELDKVVNKKLRKLGVKVEQEVQYQNKTQSDIVVRGLAYLNLRSRERQRIATLPSPLCVAKECYTFCERKSAAQLPTDCPPREQQKLNPARVCQLFDPRAIAKYIVKERQTKRLRLNMVMFTRILKELLTHVINEKSPFTKDDWGALIAQKTRANLLCKIFTEIDIPYNDEDASLIFAMAGIPDREAAYAKAQIGIEPNNLELQARILELEREVVELKHKLLKARKRQGYSQVL